MCVKCKYKQNIMIETFNFEENSLFEQKCLNVGLPMPSKITNDEKQTTLSKINIFLSKLQDICPEDLYNNIINNSTNLIHLQQELQS